MSFELCSLFNTVLSFISLICAQLIYRLDFIKFAYAFLTFKSTFLILISLKLSFSFLKKSVYSQKTIVFLSERISFP